MSTKQLIYWEGTSFETDYDYTVIMECLKQFCDQWMFQKEECPNTNRKHWQIHMKLSSKKRLNEVVKMLKGTAISGIHLSPTHDVNASNFYVMKSESRIDGPWCDKQTNSDMRVKMPWDLERIKEWYPWQLSLFESLKEKDDRHINVLVDVEGGNGKSKALKFALWKKWCGLVPCIGDAKDLIQAACSMGEREAYILDLPRTGEGDKHLASQIKAIEQIKNGVVIDFRYKYEERIFGSPIIWVFTNQEIPSKLLSNDRWVQWRIIKGQLVKANMVP